MLLIFDFELCIADAFVYVEGAVVGFAGMRILDCGAAGVKVEDASCQIRCSAGTSRLSGRVFDGLCSVFIAPGSNSIPAIQQLLPNGAPAQSWHCHRSATVLISRHITFGWHRFIHRIECFASLLSGSWPVWGLDKAVFCLRNRTLFLLHYSKSCLSLWSPERSCHQLLGASDSFYLSVFSTNTIQGHNENNDIQKIGRIRLPVHKINFSVITRLPLFKKEVHACSSLTK